MCEMPLAQFWTVILSPTSLKSLFANIGATKLHRLFYTAQFRLRRCCPKKRRRFAASEEPQYAINFQGPAGASHTTAARKARQSRRNLCLSKKSSLPTRKLKKFAVNW